MNDFLEYMKTDPYFRKFNHNKMTFSMTYAYSEKYILVISHDEVVHLKCSMLNKMPGYSDDKFKNLKAAYAFMFSIRAKSFCLWGRSLDSFVSGARKGNLTGTFWERRITKIFSPL